MPTVTIVNDQIQLTMPNGATATLSLHAASVLALQVDHAHWQLCERQAGRMDN